MESDLTVKPHEKPDPVTDSPETMKLESVDVAADRIAALRAIVPEAFTETGIDWDALRRSLGDWVDPGKERFGLNWPGKAECMRIIQQPSVGTLLPKRDESVEFDNTENVIIEGDNLEVLKLLQKSYYGKVKMIYIDPPYNTGNEFIYPDNFKEGLQDYLRYSGQTDEEGLKLNANAETDGRYHSKWLNMMYPRLFLARNLLRDDGVIFASIDDVEQAHLRLLMDDVFGPENFMGCVSVVSNLKGRSDDQYFATAHNYALAYKRATFVTRGVPLPDEYWDEYREVAPDGRRYRLQGLRKRGSGALRSDRPGMHFPIYVDPESQTVSLERSERHSEEVIPLLSDGSEGRWRWGRETASERLGDLRGQKVNGTRWDVFQIDYAEVDGETKRIKPKSIWIGTEFANEAGTLETKKLLGKGQFDNPKPTGLVRYLLEQSVTAGDIILDFFAGSGTTGDAVIRHSLELGIPLSYLLVQLPEQVDGGVYPTISAITRARMKKASESASAQSAAPDPGFRSYRLGASNFAAWSGESQATESVQEQLLSLADNTVEGRSEEDILTELLLKAGFPITASVDRLRLAGKTVFSVADGALLLSLDEDVTIEVVEEMVNHDPHMIICLDEGFHGDDQLKVNVVQTVEAHNRNAESDIVFRVV